MSTRLTQQGPTGYSAAEWAVRTDLAACYRLIAHFGMSELISNHISASVPGAPGEFLINPFGFMYEEITASCLIRVAADGTVLHNPNTDCGINRAGYVIHSAIHEARPDVGCVIHTHTPAGIAISALECGILPISQSSMRFAKVAYHDFEGVAFNEGEKERLAANLGDAQVMVLRNHGLVACGADIPQAFNAMFRLERICQIQLHAMACNSPLRMPAADAIARANAQYTANQSGMGAGAAKPLGVMEWPAMLRMLDRRDRSFRD